MEQWFNCQWCVGIKVAGLCANRRESSGKVHGDGVVGAFYATLFAAEGVVPVYIVLMMSTGAKSPVWVNR